jgi:hypothetical protein
MKTALPCPQGCYPRPQRQAPPVSTRKWGKWDADSRTLLCKNGRPHSSHSPNEESPSGSNSASGSRATSSVPRTSLATHTTRLSGASVSLLQYYSTALQHHTSTTCCITASQNYSITVLQYVTLLQHRRITV